MDLVITIPIPITAMLLGMSSMVEDPIGVIGITTGITDAVIMGMAITVVATTAAVTMVEGITGMDTTMGIGIADSQLSQARPEEG